jgi:hypothetical protein
MSSQDRLPVEAPRRASPDDVVGVGIAFAAAGLYFVIDAAGYLPLPEVNGPHFLGYCVGAAFLFAGLTCLVRARAGMADAESAVPGNAPVWIKLSYRVLAIGIAGALAIIGTWIAIGSGPRAFNLSAPFVETRTTGETIGRVVFALGAVITWIYVIALTVGTVRKIFDRRDRPGATTRRPR